MTLKPYWLATTMALSTAGALALVACDADDDVPVILADDASTAPPVVVDSSAPSDGATEAQVDASTQDSGSDSSSGDGATDSASDAKND